MIWLLDLLDKTDGEKRRIVHASPNTIYRTYLLINRLWKSLLSMSFTNSLLCPLSSVPLAWFLNTTSSSHLRLTVKSGLFNSGLPLAMSLSCCSASAAAFSRSSRSRFSCRSRFTRSSSRCSSASSSSESLSSESLSSSSSSFPDPFSDESLSSASMSRVVSNIRLRFASGSSSSASGAASSRRFVPEGSGIFLSLSSSVDEGPGPPRSLDWWTASAAISSARRSRTC